MDGAGHDSAAMHSQPNAAEEARPRAPFGPWEAQKARAASWSDSVQPAKFSRGLVSSEGEITVLAVSSGILMQRGRRRLGQDKKFKRNVGALELT